MVYTKYGAKTRPRSIYSSSFEDDEQEKRSPFDYQKAQEKTDVDVESLQANNKKSDLRQRLLQGLAMAMMAYSSENPGATAAQQMAQLMEERRADRQTEIELQERRRREQIEVEGREDEQQFRRDMLAEEGKQTASLEGLRFGNQRSLQQDDQQFRERQQNMEFVQRARENEAEHRRRIVMENLDFQHQLGAIRAQGAVSKESMQAQQELAIQAGREDDLRKKVSPIVAQKYLAAMDKPADQWDEDDRTAVDAVEAAEKLTQRAMQANAMKDEAQAQAALQRNQGTVSVEYRDQQGRKVREERPMDEVSAPPSAPAGVEAKVDRVLGMVGGDAQRALAEVDASRTLTEQEKQAARAYLSRRASQVK